MCPVGLWLRKVLLPPALGSTASPSGVLMTGSRAEWNSSSGPSKAALGHTWVRRHSTPSCQLAVALLLHLTSPQGGAAAGEEDEEGFCLV